MALKQTFTILGCGSSGGVPRIGNNWGQCDPENPRNRRRRCALLAEQALSDDPDNITRILIDAGPDMRAQLIDQNVDHLDAVLLTHAHADHLHGIDDLRQLAIMHRKRIDVYFDERTTHRAKSAFQYIFEQMPGSNYPAICNHHLIEDYQDIPIDGRGGVMTALPFVANHGEIEALGFRMNTLAYLPDVKDISDIRSLEILSNLDVLIIDALRRTQHPSHFSLDDALAFIDRVKPKRAILTNMHVDMDYATLVDELPDHIEPAYDGMTIEI